MSRLQDDSRCFSSPLTIFVAMRESFSAFHFVRVGCFKIGWEGQVQ